MRFPQPASSARVFQNESSYTCTVLAIRRADSEGPPAPTLACTAAIELLLVGTYPFCYVMTYYHFVGEGATSGAAR